VRAFYLQSPFQSRIVKAQSKIYLLKSEIYF
jgi:hypothetical protein